MNSPIDLAGVVRLLEAGHTVVMPSQAAAQWLRAEFSYRQRAANRRAWEPPSVLSWSQWLEAQWNGLTLEGHESRVLLNRLQEETLWVALAPSAGVHADGHAASEFARQASSALALAAEFGALNRLERAADSPDSRTFAAWYRIFVNHCQGARLLPRALLAEALLEHLRASRWSPPGPLHFLGFEAPSPQQSSVWEALRQAETSLQLHDLHHGGAGSVLHGSSVTEGTPEDELRWAIRWARRQHLSTRKLAGGTAPRQVALILPNPESERPSMEPLLREFLAPELEFVGADLSSTPWHFSTGARLASSTLVDHALLLLRWLTEEISTDSIGTLLLSPYLAHEDSLEDRARFELQGLRRQNALRTEMTLEGLLHLAAGRGTGPSQAGPSLRLQRWRDLHRIAARRPRSSATFGEWAEHLRHLLQVAGWPGSRTLSPIEYELTEAWEGLLDLLATLDLYGRKVTLPQFLEQLSGQARQITFRTENINAPVQIMRLSEMEGRLFEAVLVLRATDAFLPLPETPHPLLGRLLQKSLAMPGSDAAAAQGRSRALLQSVGKRTPTLLLLTAEHDANGPLRLTGLASALQLPKHAPETLLPPVAETAPIRTEPVQDVDPLPALPSSQVSGGARVLELQARCGFSAFAALRLRAEAPESASLGFDPREAGQMLHKALEIFWSGISTQQELRGLTAAARETAVQQAVQQAMHAHHEAQGSDHPWTEAYLEVAETRLTRLMLHWLQHELQRGDFSVVTQEQKRLVTLGPLELRVRPDRIDQVENGLVFVDYKTSADLSTRHWLGERPSAPQLPLYALLEDPDKVKGVAFGRVRAGREMGWISLQAEELLFPKGSVTTESLSEQIAAWRAELTRLATEFAEGVATVDPKAYPKTCEYCQARLLCRLDAPTLLASARNASPPDEENKEGDSAR